MEVVDSTAHPYGRILHSKKTITRLRERLQPRHEVGVKVLCVRGANMASDGFDFAPTTAMDIEFIAPAPAHERGPG
jgi:hypothetical protein